MADSIRAIVIGVNQLIFEANQKGGVVFGEYVVKMFVLEEDPVETMLHDHLTKYPVRLWFPRGIFDRKGGDLIETVENTEAVSRFLISMQQIGKLELVETIKDYTKYRYLDDQITVLIYNSVDFPVALLDVYRVMARFRWDDFQYSDPDLYYNPYMVRSLLGAITKEQYDRERIDRIRFNRKIINMQATIEAASFDTINHDQIKMLIDLRSLGWQINLPNAMSFGEIVNTHGDADLDAILHQSQKSQFQIESVPIVEEHPLIYHYRMAAQLFQQMPTNAQAVILELLQAQYGKFII